MPTHRAPRPAHLGRRLATRATTALLALGVAGGVAAGVVTSSDPDPANAATQVRTTTLRPNWGDTTPVAGQRVLLYGFAFPAVSGRLLKVQTPGRTAGVWETVGSVRTVANGSYTVYLKHTVAGPHRYRLHAPRTTTASGATSRTVRYDVLRRSTTVTAALSRRYVPVGQVARITGTVGPDFTARTVTVQGRRTGTTAWSKVGSVRLNASNRYTLTLPTGTVGSRQYRAVVAATAYAKADASPLVALTVTKP